MDDILKIAYLLIPPLLAILLIWRGFPASCDSRKPPKRKDDIDHTRH
jgi:hypothetical protein